MNAISAHSARVGPELPRTAARDTPLPLAEAKLAVPGVHHGVVDRPRVHSALSGGLEASLTVVAAPAGYGKTVAVRAWCESLDAAPAWVTLDAGDNDPTRLWTYVATAFERVRPGLGRGALRLLDEAAPVEAVVDALMNGAAALEGELVVVLDDLHTVTSEECLASIEHAIAGLPPRVHMLLLTRSDPALRLARPRADGAVAELRASELKFTAAEAHELLVVLGRLEIGADEIDVLVERTEGWPAGLVLAWLWLRARDDPAQAVADFGGDHRFVADYLSSEVLAALDDDRRGFLQAAAVLGRFTAELCDGVLERSDSAARLAELEHSNLFVSRLERGGWFRIHSMFAEYATAQLLALEPGAPRRIHRRAADWLDARGLPAEAVEHAAAAGEHELVARLLIEYHLPLIRSGAGPTLLRWVRTLPDEELVEHPPLAAAAAAAAMLIGGRRLEQRRLLALADEGRERRADRADPYVEAATLLVHATTIDRGVAQAVRDGRRAVTLAEADAGEVLTGALASYARALFFAGEGEEASAVAMACLRHPAIERNVPSLVAACSTLAFIAAEEGRLASARRHAERAKAAVGRIGRNRSWLGANAASALGVVLAAEGSLSAGERELAAAAHYFKDDVATLHHTWLLVLLARVRLRRGRLAGAETTVRFALEALEELPDSGPVPALAKDVERDIAAARARSGAAAEAPSAAELPVLRLLAGDMSTREIGERLFLSPNTIRSHKRSLYHKLGVHSRSAAVARATALGLLEQTQSPG